METLAKVIVEGTRDIFTSKDAKTSSAFTGGSIKKPSMLIAIDYRGRLSVEIHDLHVSAYARKAL